MIGIYKITNLLTNQVYIGQSNNIERRFQDHLFSSKQKIDQDIQTYGKDNFSFEIIEECSLEDLTTREQYWINEYDSFYHGYNATRGGPRIYDGNPKLSIEDVIAIRQAYANHKNRQEVYKLYQEKITFDGFCHVWDGSRWKDVMPEVFSEENKSFYRSVGRFNKGQGHPNSKLTDEEVLKIRIRYQTETASQIWQDYQTKYSLGSFKQILIGVKYSHLPIYKKTEKRWINGEPKDSN